MTWSKTPLPGVCTRCNRVYLTGEVTTPDPLGGIRGQCCAVTRRVTTWLRRKEAA